MAITTRYVEYRDGDAVLEGMLAYDGTGTIPAPGVVVCHAWGGRSEFECERARALAELGYVGFALDVFGKGVLTEDRDECAEQIKPFMEDRALLQRRLAAGVEAARGQAEVDAKRMAGIGYCFGGLCALDMARFAMGLKGVVSFHGLLTPPGIEYDRIEARVLVLHGWDDPMVPPDQVMSLAEEMTAAEADWQLHAYGDTLHAFTKPGANDPAFGTVYKDTAARRSWQSMQNFLGESFAG